MFTIYIYTHYIIYETDFNRSVAQFDTTNILDNKIPATMSRTMKANEAISALAFISDPEEFIDSSDPVNNKVQQNSIDASREDSLLDTLTNSFTNILNKADLGKKTLSGSSLKAISQSSLKKISVNTETDTRNSRGVGFGTVEVRKYPIMIGTNPAVSSGVPHTIHWDHLKDETEKVHINQYEREHPTHERKHGDDLVLDGITRAKMLKNVGYTKQELVEGMKAVGETKKNRNSIKLLRASSSF